jgi:hypothetical protein
VVYAPGKEAKAVAASLQALLQRQRKAIAVKVDAAMAKAVTELLPGATHFVPSCLPEHDLRARTAVAYRTISTCRDALLHLM